MDLADTGNRSLDPPVNSYPNGFLDSIKALRITTKRQKYLSPQLGIQAMSNLLLLLGALPRDSLTRFQAAHFKLGHNAIGLLLRTQSRLSY